MSDPQTYWLNVANIALAVPVAIGLIAAAGGVLHELISRRRERRAAAAELEMDFRRLFARRAAG